MATEPARLSRLDAAAQWEGNACCNCSGTLWGPHLKGGADWLNWEVCAGCGSVFMKLKRAPEKPTPAPVISERIAAPVEPATAVARPPRQPVRVPPLILAACAALVAPPVSMIPPTPLLGIAVRSGADVCLSIADRLPVGATLTLADPSTGTTARAEVEGPGQGCPGAIVGAMNGYQLRLAEGPVLVANNNVLVAVADTGRLDVVENRVFLEPGVQGRRQVLQSCTDGDGVHLTSWDADDPRPTRRWHVYYRLNKDVDFACSLDEVTG